MQVYVKQYQNSTILWKVSDTRRIKMGIFNMMELTSDKSATPEETKDTPEVNKTEAAKVDDTTTVIKKQDNIIELKGSLSDVYTKALNAEYALENIQSIVNSIVSDNTESAAEPVYVEVIDKDEVENQDVLALSKNLRIALDKRSNKRSMVVLESDPMNYKTMLIKDFVTSLGVECIEGRDKAIARLTNILER